MVIIANNFEYLVCSQSNLIKVLLHLNLSKSLGLIPFHILVMRKRRHRELSDYWIVGRRMQIQVG